MRGKIVIAFIIFGFYLQAQQVRMATQFMFNKMAMNPAYAGHEKYTGLTVMVRDQWNGIPGAPKTQMLSANLPRIKDKIGIGFNLSSQQIGIFRSNTLSGIYSYKFLFGENNILSTGIEIAGRNLVADFTDPQLIATQGLSNDPSIPNEKIGKTNLNVGLGIYFSSNRYYLGATIPRLIQSDLDYDNNFVISEEVPHFIGLAGTQWPVSKELSLATQAMFRYVSNAPLSLDLNFSATLDDKYTAGLTYRSGGTRGDIGESLDLIFGFKINDKFMIGFSNDFMLSRVRRYGNGSLELVMSYALGKKRNNVVVVNPRYF